MKRHLLLLAVPVILAMVALACGEDEEAIGTTPPVSGSHAVTSSPSKTASSTTTPAKTPAITPSPEWKVYVDPVLRYSFQYPGDLVPRDLTGPTSNCCPSERVIDFRPSGAKTPGLSVSITDVEPGTSLREWASKETACSLDQPPGNQDIALAGRPALICVAEPLDDQFENGAVILDGRHMMYITSTIPAEDFQRLTNSLQFDQ